ncbi:hypothetical protein [Clostridium sp. MD294]|uniref:hypothetical protein n=1 Tax=Clostridium sp. MD294 TaxID=97138 RepID=UPI0002CB42E6|nr:hypothetical protein [Clostridium sp. MD294]NDO46975.1 hypothetical protein [Clostridium sp. MD294]USF31362.1 hypothetical protein C820_002808 [Clostridium sp. MD294]
MKKLLIVATMLLMGFSTSAYANELSSSEPKGEIVPYEIYNISSEDSRSMDTPLSEEERIDYMEAHGETPGTQFLIGNKKYEVTDDYELCYLGIDETVDVDCLSDTARGMNIPTSKGSLPYSGKYNISNYVYSDRYFNVGKSGDLDHSIAVTVSANAEQDIMVSWMDARNDQSMANKTYYFNHADSVTKYAWVYSGEDFYFKLTNKMPSRAIAGTYRVEVDD